jgi:sulfur-oxidizing protein SoxZ
MSDRGIQIRAKHTHGVTRVRALIRHPMSDGRTGPDADGKDGNPHFIQEVTCSLGDETVMTALWGSDIAKDPLLGFTFKGGRKGEIIHLSWVDNRGGRDSIETVIA